MGKRVISIAFLQEGDNAMVTHYFERRTATHSILLFCAFVALMSSTFMLPSFLQSTRQLDDTSCYNKSFELAIKQSFGFFTDITDDQWRLAQKIHAKVFPNIYGDQESVVSDTSVWYGSNFQEEFHCAAARRLPSNPLPDGPKWVCDPHRIAAQEKCLVYSFGSFGNVEFERGVKEEIGEHCEIHTFDIETSNAPNGDYEQLLNKYGVTFHNWGIANEQKASHYARTKEGPPMYTLEKIMTMLNHTGRIVDIFKIDCEECEWEVYSQFIGGAMLRQILVETHSNPMPAALNFFKSLHDAGYVIFSKECNYYCKGQCVEYAFLKLHDEFFIHDTKYNSVKWS
jgi:hypothetical protein